MRSRFAVLVLLLFPVSAVVHAAVEPSGVPVVVSAVASQAAVTTQDFVSAVFAAAQSFGGGSWALRCTMCLMLIVASMKVSRFDDLVWKRLGPYQGVLAPLLGLVIGISVLAMQHTLTTAGAFAYLGTGIGAVGLHELLDAVKALPWIGPNYARLIALAESVLGGNPTPNPDVSQVLASRATPTSPPPQA